MEDSTQSSESQERPVQVGAGALFLKGLLSIPQQARGVVLFPYGIEDGQHKTYAEAFAHFLRRASDKENEDEQFAVLIIDMFTSEERTTDAETGFFRDNVSILSQRITGAANWLLEMPETQNLRICYCGIGIVGAAALQAAAERPDTVVTVVAMSVTDSELALVRDYLPRIEVPILLFTTQQKGIEEHEQQNLLERLHAEKRVETIEDTNFFAEAAQQEEVMHIARQWLGRQVGLG